MSFGSARTAGSKPARRLEDRIPTTLGISSQLIGELRDGGSWRRAAKKAETQILGGRMQKNNVWVACSWLGFEFLHVRRLAPNRLD